MRNKVKQSIDKARESIGKAYLKTGVAVSLIGVSTASNAADKTPTMPIPDVAPVVEYIGQMASGPVFQVGSAGIMFYVALRGIKRVRTVF